MIKTYNFEVARGMYQTIARLESDYNQVGREKGGQGYRINPPLHEIKDQRPRKDMAVWGVDIIDNKTDKIVGTISATRDLENEDMNGVLRFRCTDEIIAPILVKILAKHAAELGGKEAERKHGGP